jgi:glycosyltransferase involved in cell wall biosynthesis
VNHPSPFFSIIIPTYNRATVLGKTIQSIVKQSFTDFEVLIIDDGSIDNTEEIIQAIGDSRIIYFKKKNEERAVARNFGTKHAKGLYVNFFDSDDLMYSDRLQKVADQIQSLQQPDVLFTHYDVINTNEEVIDRTELSFKTFTKNLLHNNFLACGSVFLKRTIALSNLFCEARELITAEDWELWMRLHIQYEFRELPVSTFALVQHKDRSLNTISLDRVIERETYFIQLIKHNHLFRQKYGNKLNLLIADRYTFMALSLAIHDQKLTAFVHLAKSFFSSIRVLKRRRFWGALKTILWPLRNG